ncbi:MAG: CHAD domain-containing protein [Chlorobiaceae bacterium]|nr:CHAD domain-containing protein [Chlorobiaceae bacterium]
MDATPKKIIITPGHLLHTWPTPEQMNAAGWKLVQLSSRQEERVFYDTFDWLAFEKAFAVIKQKRSLHLADLDTGHEIDSTPFPGNPALFFPNRLADSKLKKLLDSCGDMRAFIKLCTVETTTQQYQLLDRQDKTIGTLSSEIWHLAENQSKRAFCHIYSIKPFKGFDEEVEDFESWLSSHDDFQNSVQFRDLFMLLMKEAGLNVKGYSSKILLQLDKDVTIHANALKLLRSTITIIQQNETGISRDIDSEFLHDYRVAIRRTRSVLMLLKGVFDPDETAHYLNAFKEIGKLTNALRDMDVYLLRQATYFDYLPPILHPALKEFFLEIAAKRNTLHKQFCRYLVSKKYQTFLKEWSKWISQGKLPLHDKAPNATLQTSAIAAATIKKAWKKVIRHGRQINRDATDRDLHSLRIECKKLRYLIEFFSSIFPHKTIAPIITQLKTLQENLGNFTDFAVQIEFLDKRLVSMQTQKNDILMAATTGGLIAILYEKKEDTRRKFHNIFKAFDDEETAKLMHEILLTLRTQHENHSTL